MKLVLLILFFLSAVAVAQNPLPPTAKDRPESQRDASQEQSMPAEMRIRMEIERADNEHKKILEDGQRLNDLSSQVAKHYQEAGKLSSDDMKNISTIEKLAKRILSFAGGSEEKSDDFKPAPLGDMLNHLSDLTAKVNNTLKAETRLVISATLIANSNEAINLVQFIKKTVK